ncbi:MAG: hypothetical protein HOW97_34410 [Catenulispora sp.]|nr:hypothetical protein [Catenulispora sp.]
MPENHRFASRALGLAALTGAVLAAAPVARADAPDTTPKPMTPAELTRGLSAVPLYPLAGGPLDLLSNRLAVPVGGTEVSTSPVTAPFRNGLPLRDVPAVGSLLVPGD